MGHVGAESEAGDGCAVSFQVGDRVRVDAPGEAYHGAFGTIGGVDPSGSVFIVNSLNYGTILAGADRLYHATTPPVTIGAAGQPPTITTAQQYQQVTGMLPPAGIFPPLTYQGAPLVLTANRTITLGEPESPTVVVVADPPPPCSWCSERHVSPKCDRYAQLYRERLATGLDDCEGARAELVRWADARDEDERTRKRRGLP